MARKERKFTLLYPKHRYAFRVAAIRWGGKYGDYSEPVYCDISAVPEFQAPELNALGFPLMDLILVSWTGVGFVKGRTDLDEYRVYRSTEANASICDALDAKIADGEDPYIAWSGGGARVIAETRTTFFVDVGYDEDNPSKNPYGPVEDTNYYYWVRAIGKDGLKGKLSGSDNAILGPPPADTITDLQFDEDRDASFLWLKGWKITWTPSTPSEGYFVRYRRQGTTIWSLSYYVSHDSDETVQSCTIPLLFPQRYYEFQVKPVNHYILKKYHGEWYQETSYVQDLYKPDPPEQLTVQQKLFHNTLYWTKPSADTDIAYYQIFWSNSPSDTPGNKFNAVAPALPLCEKTHYFSGKFDNLNYYYWVRSVDWSNKTSDWAGPESENEPAEQPVVYSGKFFRGTWLNWKWLLGDHYYSIYRKAGADPDTDSVEDRMVEKWYASFFIDVGQIKGWPITPGATYHYAIKVTRFNLAQNSSVPAELTPETLVVDDLPDDIPMSKLVLDYNQIILSASSTVIAKEVNKASITMTPQAIEMKAGIGGIYSGSNYLGLYAQGGNGTLFLGNPINPFTIVSLQGTRLIARMPTSAGGSDHKDYELYYDRGYVKASLV